MPVWVEQGQTSAVVYDNKNWINAETLAWSFRGVGYYKFIVSIFR